MRQIEIHFRGQIDPRWHKWFGGLSLSQSASNEMVLSGVVADQAELYGVISHLRDLGLELISVTSIMVGDDLHNP